MKGIDKLEVHCEAVVGDDVAVHLHRSQELADSWADPHLAWFIGLTSEEAVALAFKLLDAAYKAEREKREMAQLFLQDALQSQNQEIA